MSTCKCSSYFERTGTHADGCSLQRGSQRIWMPHWSPKAHRSFSASIFQIVGGRRWSLCLVTKIDGDKP